MDRLPVCLLNTPPLPSVPPPQEIIFTDDVSLQVFMDHLARLSVQS
jgi:hypothetical protein